MKKIFLVAVLGLFFVVVVAMTAAAQTQPAVSGLPADAEELIGSGSLVEIYCLNTKYKSGRFFAMLDSAAKELPPVMAKVAETGAVVQYPDLETWKATGAAKLEAICQAKTLAKAQEAAADFKDFGITVQQRFDQLETDLEKALSDTSNALKKQIQARVEPKIKQEIERLESELRSKASKEAIESRQILERELSGKIFSSAKGAESYVRNRMPELEATIDSKMSRLSSQAKASIRAYAQAAVDELALPEKTRMEALGRELRALSGRIESGISSRLGQYQQYAAQAANKRRAAIIAYVDAQIAYAYRELGTYSSEMDQLKQIDPSAPTFDDMIRSMQTERGELDAALGKALEVGDEVAVRQAMERFRQRWEGHRDDMAEAFNKPETACGQARLRISPARVTVNDQLRRMDDLMSDCAGKSDERCRKVMALSSRFLEMEAQIKGILSDMDRTEKLCKEAEAKGEMNPDIFTSLSRLQERGQALHQAGMALEAERETIDHWAKQRASETCRANLPRIDAGLSEMDRVYGVWETQLEACQSGALNGSECRSLELMKDETDQVKSEMAEVKRLAASFRNDCGGLDSLSTSEQVWERFSDYLERSGQLDLLVKEIRFKAASIRTASQACEAARPLANAGGREYAIAMERLDSVLDSAQVHIGGCRATPDESRCRQLQAAAEQAAETESQYAEYVKPFWDFDDLCRQHEQNKTGTDYRNRITGSIDVLDDMAEAGRDKAAEAAADLKAALAPFIN